MPSQKLRPVQKSAPGLIIIKILQFSSRFFSLIGSYLLFGALFQFTSGKRGKRMFPNHDFWCVAVPGICKVSTVLPAKSDSDVMFCLQTYQGLIIDR